MEAKACYLWTSAEPEDTNKYRETSLGGTRDDYKKWRGARTEAGAMPRANGVVSRRSVNNLVSTRNTSQNNTNLAALTTRTGSARFDSFPYPSVHDASVRHTSCGFELCSEQGSKWHEKSFRDSASFSGASLVGAVGC